jgi:putative SOS response-associated peptidase YedK
LRAGIYDATTDANELVAEIHDRMPLILAPSDFTL